MNYSFSDRISSLHPSAIREILKNTSRTDIISFAAGNPASEALPFQQLSSITSSVMENNPISSLQYSISEGYPPLREAIARFVVAREPGILHSEDNILVVSGAQQGIELIAKCLLNEGDTVLCETPSFVGALNALRSYRPNLVGIPMDKDGINLEQLEKALQEQNHVKLLYLIPNFQNPTGYTLSLEKRIAIYKMASYYGTLILEDNPYGDLRFAGQHIPAIKTMDTAGLVLYVGSFSKIIAPGLRVGYIIANQKLLSKLVVAKQCSDVHTSVLSQMICERFLTTSNMTVYLAKLQHIYKTKASILLTALKRIDNNILSWQVPQGGLFVWCTLSPKVDTSTYCQAAARAGVTVVPGNTFLVNTNQFCSSFRINFSTPTNQQLVEGVELLRLTLENFV